MQKNNNNFIFYMLLTCLVLLIYSQIIGHDFVSIDDHVYVTSNSYVQNGFCQASIKWALTTFYAEFWHPITWFSLMLDTELFGINPAGYHFTNMLLHLLNTILLFSIFRRMTNDAHKSLFIAILFAIHPLHVETVAWIAERKDVLCTFFFMLTIWYYLDFVEKPLKRKYLIVTLFFVLGFMSKSMIVTLPFVLLLIDYWPIGRIRFPLTKQLVLPILAEKIPLFIIMVFFIVITIMAQQSGGGIAPLESYSMSDRIANALISYNQYILKTFWPNNLSVFYPFPDNFQIIDLIVSLTSLLVITGFSLFWVIKRPYFVVGWFWYIGILVPVIGLIKIGDFAMADRFTYIPFIGLSIILIWGWTDIASTLKIRKHISVAAFVLITVLLTLTARSQTKYWRNTNDLFKHALSVSSKNFFAHYALAHDLIKRGDIKNAVFHFSEAARLSPGKAILNVDKGRSLIVLGKYAEAKQSFLEAIAIKPEHEKAHYYLGINLVLMDKPDLAAKHFYIASQKTFNTDYKRTPEKYQLSHTYYQSGIEISTTEKTYGPAADFYLKALSIQPGYLPAIKSLTEIYINQNDYNKLLSLYHLENDTNHLIGAVVKGYDNWDFLNLIGKKREILSFQ